VENTVAYAVQSSPEPGRLLVGGATVKLAVAGLAIALAVAYLVSVGLQSSAVYFLTVSELQAKSDQARTGQVFRVSGTLVPGSLVRESGGLGVTFALADASSAPLTVTYRGGQVPDIIGDDIEMVVEGKLDGSTGVFRANTVLAKCPSKLENSATPDERDYAAGDGAPVQS
jgi:cytochrome c-type biogenesis protein CcmE